MLRPTAVLGATGFIGRAVVDELLRRGVRVRALARDPSRLAERQGLEVMRGDATVTAQLSAVMNGTSAVVSCVGVPRAERVPPEFLAGIMQSLITAMRASGIARLVAISGAAVDVHGEVKPLRHRAMSRLVRAVAAAAVESKQLEFDVLARSADIAWTAVRPTRVVPGAATGRPRISTDAKAIGMRVTVGDVAAFIADLAQNSGYVHEAPFISS